MNALSFTLDATTLTPATLAMLAAEITHQIEAQDWSLDSYGAVETILIALAGNVGVEEMDRMMQDAGADAHVYDLLTTGLVMAGRIS